VSDTLAGLTLDEASSALGSRRVSARELVDACVARIERLQPAINAFLTVDRDAALAATDTADERRRRGAALGPLDGIPVAHKDLFDRAGRVTTAGSIILGDRRAEETATVIARLDRAGAIELGTLNLAEFAAGATGHNRHFGDCRNPWNPDRIPGGSSSGSASAVAGRLVYASLGSDTGGSIRLPAHFSGVVGLRPTQGRVSRSGIFPRSWAMDAAGPLTRTVADAAIVLAAIAGPDPADPTTESIPVEDYRAALDAPVGRLRVGIPESYFFEQVDDGIRRLLDAALETIAGLGVAVAPVTVPDPERPFRLARIIAKAEAAAIHQQWIRQRPGDYDHGIREEMESGLFVSAVDYLDALRARGPVLSEWLDGPFAEADVLFTPVMDDPTPLLSDCAPTSPDAAAKIMARFGRCTRPISYLGLPALAVPCGFQPDGMPAGFQLVGRPFGEADLLRLGHAYQQVTTWHDMDPSREGPLASHGKPG
jgi:aspartyl-tRNA(Asn)/glutamyl-tRNA(Gln) amidotransferase subunit A